MLSWQYVLCSKKIIKQENYFFLCLLFRKRFLRLWVAILCLFLFFPLGMALKILKSD